MGPGVDHSLLSTAEIKNEWRNTPTSPSVSSLSAHGHLYIFPILYLFLSEAFLPIPMATRSKATRLLGLGVRIQPGACISVCCECCVLSGRGLCDGIITLPEEFYPVYCVLMWSRKPVSLLRHRTKKLIYVYAKHQLPPSHVIRNI
jgi:hypothetical protein